MSLEHDTRPWGEYQVLADEADHKVKRITLLPGKRLSLQYHKRRAEHWFFLQGSGTVTCGKQEIPVKAGSAVDIPRGAEHRAANQGSQPLIWIEVQIGDYFGEDDITRLEDDFGRA